MVERNRHRSLLLVPVRWSASQAEGCRFEPGRPLEGKARKCGSFQAPSSADPSPSGQGGNDPVTRRRWGRWGSLRLLVAALAVAPSAQASAKTVPLSMIEAYVSQAVGTTITIACDADSLAGYEGFVTYGADGRILHVIHVRAVDCSNAEAADHKQVRHALWFLNAHDGSRMDYETGSALLAIEHEAMLVAPQSADEGLVECTAWQNRLPLASSRGCAVGAPIGGLRDERVERAIPAGEGAARRRVDGALGGT
jgi:hypothetical protein